MADESKLNQEYRVQQRKEFLAWLDSAKCKRINELKDEQQEITRERIPMPVFQEADNVSVETENSLDEQILATVGNFVNSVTVPSKSNMVLNVDSISVDMPAIVVENRQIENSYVAEVQPVNVEIPTDVAVDSFEVALPQIEVRGCSVEMPTVEVVSDMGTFSRETVLEEELRTEMSAPENILLPTSQDWSSYGQPDKSIEIAYTDICEIPTSMQWSGFDSVSISLQPLDIKCEAGLDTTDEFAFVYDVPKVEVSQGSIAPPEQISLERGDLSEVRISTPAQCTIPDCTDILEMLLQELEER